MVEYRFSIGGVFCQRCARNTVKRKIGLRKSDKLGPYTRVYETWLKPTKYCCAHSQNRQIR